MQLTQYTRRTATLTVLILLIPSAILLSQTVERAGALANMENAEGPSALKGAKERAESAGHHAELGAVVSGARGANAKVQWNIETSHFSIQPNGFIFC